MARWGSGAQAGMHLDGSVTLAQLVTALNKAGTGGGGKGYGNGGGKQWVKGAPKGGQQLHGKGGGGGGGQGGAGKGLSSHARANAWAHDPAVADAVSTTTWRGKKQTVEWMGKPARALGKRATGFINVAVRPLVGFFRDSCWVCLPPRQLGVGGGSGGGGPPAATTAPSANLHAAPPTLAPHGHLQRHQPAVKKTTDDDATMGDVATYMAALKKPPNTAAVYSATVPPTLPAPGDAAAADDGALGKGTGAVIPAGSGVVGASDASGKNSPDLLSASQLSSVKLLVDHPVVGAEMRTLLSKHRQAELAAAGERCSERAGALEVAGKTWKQVLAARVAYHGQLVRDNADLAARKEAEEDARAASAARALKVYEERVRYAQDQLNEFSTENAKREAQWKAHYSDLIDKSEARLRAAEAEVEKAKLAAEAAGDAADRVISEAEAASWSKTAGGTSDCSGTADGDTLMGEGARTAAPTTPTGTASPLPVLVPYTPPPTLATPTTDEEREKLLKAQIIVHHWLQQDDEWPLSYENLGLLPGEVAVLVGGTVWQRYYPAGEAPDGARPLKKGLVGAISCALNALEVSTAAVIANAQAAASAAMASVEAEAKRARTAVVTDESML